MGFVNTGRRLMVSASDYFFIVLGMVIYAIGFNAFILPHHVVIGGMSGVGTLVYYFSGERIPVAVAMYGGNILLLIMAYRIVGKRFVYNTVLGATMLSLLIGFISPYFQARPPLVNDMTFSVLTGGLLLGFGIGLYFSHHGTAGGTDIIAAVMEKTSAVSIGRTMMMFDMTVVGISFFLPFDGDMDSRIQCRVQTIIYGLLAIFVYSYIADRFILSGRRTIQFFILSDKWKEIAYRISHETGRGVTTVDVKGFWTDAPRTMLIVWCRIYDAADMFSIVHDVDPEAYITDCDVRGVWGNGFDRLDMKVKSRKHKSKKITIQP